ncbi:MAG: hypothetical protein VX832_01215 [Actinomycetota bacterium]|nr:hypothetical protein [Actinomycetota bacterium]
MSISVIRAKDLAPLSSKPPEPPPPFDPDAVTASITASFEAFRLGHNGAWWDYADQCEVYSEDVVAKMVNLRAYLTDRGLPPYNLQIEILDIIETAPGFAEATTRFLLSGEPVSHAETHALKRVAGKPGATWSWRLLNCDRRELEAGWRCGEAFGEHRGMCLPLWQNTKINDYEFDRCVDFFPRLYQLLTTSEEFSLNEPEDLSDICAFQDASHQGTSVSVPLTTDEAAPPFDADAVVASITESFEEFRFGNDDLWPYYAKPCRLEEWDEQSRTWVTHPEYVIAEMANLRAYLIDSGVQPSDLRIEVLEVTEQAPGIAEATTRILHLGEPMSNPGTQDLQLEDGAWKALNCDRRELKAGWRCGEAFGEARDMCLPLWMNFVKDLECDLNNPDFFSQLYLALFTSEDFSENPSENLAKICRLKPNHDDP